MTPQPANADVVLGRGSVQPFAGFNEGDEFSRIDQDSDSSSILSEEIAEEVQEEDKAVEVEPVRLVKRGRNLEKVVEVHNNESLGDDHW